MAHLLRDLRIAGREAVLMVYSDFDLYGLGEVKRLEFRRDDESDECLVELTMTYNERTTNGRSFAVLRFDGVRKLLLPEMKPRFILTELEIEDLSGDQLEGIRYRAFDNLDSLELEIFCRNIEIRLIDNVGT